MPLLGVPAEVEAQAVSVLRSGWVLEPNMLAGGTSHQLDGG